MVTTKKADFTALIPQESAIVAVKQSDIVSAMKAETGSFSAMHKALRKSTPVILEYIKTQFSASKRANMDADTLYSILNKGDFKPLRQALSRYDSFAALCKGYFTHNSVLRALLVASGLRKSTDRGYKAYLKLARKYPEQWKEFYTEQKNAPVTA